MTPKDFQRGQKLVAVYSLNRRVPDVLDVEVVGVGRKWVTFAEPGRRWPRSDRFDPADMTMDAGNYSSPGRVYLSREDYDRHERARELRHRIRQHISRAGLDGVPLDDLEAIAMLMGLGDAEE